MNKPSLFLAVIALAFGSTAILADIAPTQYVGRAIRPIGVTDIRMVSAKVDIEWGFPCTLSAVFVMENKTSSPADIQLGFPVSLPEKLKSKSALDFSMSFDGAPAKPSDITEVSQNGNFPSESTWYRCRHIFPPGQTTVTVTTKLPATLVYHTPYREILRYCIETGASWDGTIGYEEVTIHFPSPITPDQIIQATPPSYTVTGDTVHWKFKDFKPVGRDHDISVEYLRPDVAAILANIRADTLQDPSNAGLKLKMARHLYALERSSIKEDRYGTEASALIGEVLKTDPHNADAWNLFLANDPHWSDSYNESFVKKIEAAYKNCPDDPGIRLWHELGELIGGAASSESGTKINQINQQLREQMKKQGVDAVDFHYFDYGYW